VRAAIRWLKDTDSDLFEDRRLERPRTKTRPLPGAVGLEEPTTGAVRRFAGRLAQEHDVPLATAEHLADVYGTRARAVVERMRATPALAEPMQPDLPYVWAEVAFAAEEELAQTVEDVLVRRVPLMLVGLDQGLDVAERTADILAERLGWSAQRRLQDIDRYARAVADSRRFRT